MFLYCVCACCIWRQQEGVVSSGAGGTVVASHHMGVRNELQSSAKEVSVRNYWAIASNLSLKFYSLCNPFYGSGEKTEHHRSEKTTIIQSLHRNTHGIMFAPSPHGEPRLMQSTMGLCVVEVEQV